jgi:hypothetical protein
VKRASELSLTSMQPGTSPLQVLMAREDTVEDLVREITDCPVCFEAYSQETTT